MALSASGPAWTESAALAAADNSNEPVEVVALRSERREVFAQPDGTFQAREYTEPVRMIRAGKWIEIDEALVKREDGRWGPKAATVDLSFAGGAKDEPFVTLRRAGREMSLTWPDGVLPAPKIEGSTATYAEVHPGVDLVVRAEADGFGHLLVVKTPQAAAAPEIAKIALGLKTVGLKVSEDASWAIAAKDEAVDGTVFEAGKPKMWDSAATAESGTTRSPATGWACGGCCSRCRCRSTRTSRSWARRSPPGWPTSTARARPPSRSGSTGSAAGIVL